MQADVIVGPQPRSDGTLGAARGGRTGEVVVSDAHGRFYETNSRNALYSGGMGLTSISNATYTTGTLTASCTPILGVWNPLTSSVNLIILQASLGVTMTAATSTAAAPFVWATSTANSAISTGASPFSRKTLAATGSAAKDMTNVALTGLTNNLVVRFASSLGGGSSMAFSFVGTAVGAATEHVSSVENIDGSVIVPPGGVLALLATTTPVAHSAASSLVWEEVAV